jgi:hypothetical protein
MHGTHELPASVPQVDLAQVSGFMATALKFSLNREQTSAYAIAPF